MKIGILTFHRAINYGAVLQAFSLSRYLSQKGNDVSVVDYYPIEDEKDFDIFRSWFSPKGFIYNLLVLPYSLRLKNRKKKFKEFVEHKLRITSRAYSPSELTQFDGDFDTFVSGSDQVFNPVSDNSIEAYYLSFAKKANKVAYAPSFGISTFDDELQKRLSGYLREFKGLSCRETKGAQFVERCKKKKCPVVVDPVFLTSKEEWLTEVSDIKRIIEGDYIFIYDLNGRESLLHMAAKLKEIHDISVVCLTTKKYGIHYDVDKLFINVGPLEFVKYIADAKYVLTDSFHGLSFSVILRKQFLSLIALDKSSERITNILDIIGERNRIVTKANIDNFNYGIIDNDLDYDMPLQEMIENSYDYIKDTIL